MRHAFAVAVVVFVACHTKAPAPSPDGCASDGECDLTTLGEDCCSHCGQVAATTKSIQAIYAACKGKSGGPPRCPSLDCPYRSMVAKCVSGKCTAVPQPTQ